MSGIPTIQKCLRRLMRFAQSTNEAQFLTETNGWCIRFCQKGCLQEAEERCLKENAKICGKYCKDKCMHTGVPHIPQQNYALPFLYPDKKSFK